MMKRGDVSRTKTAPRPRRDDEDETWHDCLSTLPAAPNIFTQIDASEYNLSDILTDDDSSPDRVSDSKISAAKTQTQSKAKTTRSRKVPTNGYNNSPENITLPQQNSQVVNDANCHENSLTDISAESEKPKRSRKKKSVASPPSSDPLLEGECSSEIINKRKTPQKRTKSKPASVNKPNGNELEEVVKKVEDLHLSEQHELKDSSKDVSIETKTKTTSRSRKTKSKDVLDMPTSVDDLSQIEGGSCPLKEPLVVDKLQKTTKPRRSKQNVVVEQTLPSECSTDNMLNVVNVTENETKTKSKGTRNKKNEIVDSPFGPDNQSEKLSDHPVSPCSSDQPLVGSHLLGADNPNLVGKRKLPEYEISAPKRDRQTEKKDPRTHTEGIQGLLNITVKKGCVEVDDSCKIPTYPTNSKKSRGNALIISNINFKSPNKNRLGGEIDHINIINLFKEMGFSITAHQDKTAQGMMEIVNRYCKDPTLERADIQITVIMSHGTEKQNKLIVKGVDFEDVDIECIVDRFSNIQCHALATKPKIFILQCCRGDDREHEKTDGLITYTSSVEARKNSDILIAYATSKDLSCFPCQSQSLLASKKAETNKGQVSYRNEASGSRYIQTICNVFMEHAHNTTVEDLLKIVDKNINSLRPGIRQFQTCSYENRGFKRCYLNPI